MKWFLSKIFWLVTEIRNWLFDKGLLKVTKVTLPVISVGNIHVGGTGKTPTVIFLASELKKQGLNPVVLSRGYKGRLKGPHLISDSDTYIDVGDEPILIRRKTKLPIVVSKNRVKGAKYIEKMKIGDVIILDDGFQHRWLFRDIDILILPSETGDLLPLGMLREDIKHKARADIIIEKPIGTFFLTAQKPISEPLTLVTGIANPDRVKTHLESLGLKIGKFVTFPDHHPFSAQEREMYIDAVTTEKDSVRFPEAKIIVGYDVWIPELTEKVLKLL